MLEEMNALMRDLQPESEDHLDRIKNITYRGRRIGDLSVDQVLVLVHALIKSVEHYRKVTAALSKENADLSLQLAFFGR